MKFRAENECTGAAVDFSPFVLKTCVLGNVSSTTSEWSLAAFKAALQLQLQGRRR